MSKLRFGSGLVVVGCSLLMLTACGEITALPTPPQAVVITEATATAVLAHTTQVATSAITVTSSPQTVATSTTSATKPATILPTTTLVATPGTASAAAVPTIIATLAPRTTDFRLAEVARSLPIIRAAPAWSNQTWVNSAPLKLADLRGKVVLVEFWTFECINCINVLPAMHQIYDQFGDKGFTIIAFHTPELSVEKDWNNVKAAVKSDGIKYPVAQDNDMKTWNAYRVNAWPTWFLIDKSGNIRYKHIGEGAYEETTLNISALLEETSK